MGEVYRATDPRLGRTVAVKVLPRELADVPARRQRLLREARSAAALNHPNICTVHEVGHAGGRDYIVFEHIEGRTLAEIVRPGGLTLAELIDLVLPLSEALAYAHGRGIVHRDLKPSNVMVSALGLPKILNFGLAREVAAPPDAQGTARAAEEGVATGTVGYMAPEQALGRPVDARPDVFAFACVAYELAAGRRAFEGASSVEVTDAVLHEDPPPLRRLRPDLPSGLTDVVMKGLRKSPAARCQGMSEVAGALRDVAAAHLGQRYAGGVERNRGRPLPLSRPTAAAVLAGVATAAAVVAYVRSGTGAGMPRLGNPLQVTVATSVEDYPTWSPDGARLAYESNESGNWEVWVARLTGGPPVNRTAHAAADRYPSWSPDGSSIAFWSDRDGGGYYVMPAQGGTARQVAATLAGPGDFYYSPPQWSADGAQLACVILERTTLRLDAFVEILSLGSRVRRRMPLPGTTDARLDLAWSRDGRFLAYVDGASQVVETTQLRVLRLSDGESVALTDDRANVRGPAWSADGRYLYFSANRAGVSDLWRQRMSDAGTPAGAAQQVTTAVEVRHAGFSADGTRMAFAKGRWVANVWRVPIQEDRAATWADAEQMTFEHAFIEFVDVSPDGRRLLFSSDRAGNQDLWTMPIGGEVVRLTADPAPEWGPRWSPDGSEIAFYASRTGNREIWVMRADGGAPRRLTDAPAVDVTPSWSPDGRTLTFRSERTGNSEIWAVASAGGDERQLTHDPAADYGPAFSPDGRWLAFASGRGGALQVWRMPAAGGTAERLTRSSTVSPVWSRDGTRLFFASIQGKPGLWSWSISDRQERLVADLSGRRGSLSLQAPATDGTHLYFSWSSDVGDIWVMDVDADSESAPSVLRAR
jgi:eukaryotic-like serine/threonine-protein kinase